MTARGQVFPELDDSKFVLDNRLSAAMDAARGGHFPGGFPRSVGSIESVFRKV